MLWTAVNIGIKLISLISDMLTKVHMNKASIKEDLMWANHTADIDYARVEDGKTHDEEKRLRNNLWLGNFALNPLSEF